MSIIDDDEDNNSNVGDIDLNDEKPNEEIITVDDPIKYVVDIILKEAKQEERLVRQLLAVMFSAKTNNPLNIAINAPTGEGKNWVLEKVYRLFNRHDLMLIQGMTEKALFHRSGNLIIHKNDIADAALNIELDEITECDRFGYFQRSYIESEINDELSNLGSQLKEQNNKKERGEEYDNDLINELEEKIQDLRTSADYVYSFTKKLINLEHKILIFLDTPKMGLLSALMPLLSHDEYESEYEYVDTSGSIKTYKNVLRGWPCCIFAQAIDYSKHERWPELQRRFIITNPTMDSKQKYAEAIGLTFKKYGLPHFAYQKEVVSDKEKQRAKEVVEYLCNKIESVCKYLEPGQNYTLLPYADALNSGFSKEKTSDMNSAKRFSSILSLLTMINIHARPTIRVHTKEEDENGPIIQTLPLATFEDLKQAMYLMQYADGVRPYQLEWFYEVFGHAYKERKEKGPASKLKKIGKNEELITEDVIGVTTLELIEATRKIRHKSYSSKAIGQTFIDPLMNEGYIDSVESQIDRRARVLFPVVTSDTIVTQGQEEQKIGIYSFLVRRNNFSQRSKFNIIDITTFPDKTYLTSRIETIVRYSSEDGLDTTLCDSDGEETHIEALIDRYYQNPEDYFECLPNGDNDEKDEPEEDKETQTQNGTTPEEYLSKGQNGVISQQSKEKDVNPTKSEKNDSNKLFLSSSLVYIPISKSGTSVVNLKDTDDFDVYIGRGSRFGPPGRMEGDDGYFGNPYKAEQYDRDECLRLYREDFYKRIETDAEFKRRILSLKSKRLACFCKPLACHGDVIIEYLSNMENQK